MRGMNTWQAYGLFIILANPTNAGLIKADTSMCSKLDPVPVCVAKMSECAPLDSLLAPLLGSPDIITACANSTGVPLKPEYYASIGKAVVTGAAGSLGKKPTSDPAANLAIRQCVLNATGMLGGDLLLDRGAVAGRVSLLAPPSLAAAVVAASSTCPEPVTYKTTEFIKCLKKTCVANAPGAAAAAPPPGTFY